MGVFGCCAQLCTLLALLLSLLGGWLASREHPLGDVFATVFKLQGIGKPQTEAVPEELMPLPRPEGELFLDLPGGAKMPASGIGMCCRSTAYDPVSVHRTVLWFLLQGGRHIDTAALYLNHEAIGLGIRDAMARGVPREEIFLTSKIWAGDFGYESSIAKAKRMVKELGVDYIDLVLLHVPIKVEPALVWKEFILPKLPAFLGGGEVAEVQMADDPIMVQYRLDTWRGLSTLRDQGLIRNIGVSNFKIHHMEEIRSLGLAPIAVLQMQYHPWVPDWMKEIVSYCHEHKIAVTAYHSLGGHDHKEKTMEIQTLNEIAKSHGRRPAQVLLRWSLQKNLSIIPGTGNHRHMADNLGTYGFALSEDEMAKLDSMQSLPISKDFFFFDV